MEELPEWKQYQIEIHTLGLYVSGNSYIVETVYSVRISVQTEQRLTSYLRLSSASIPRSSVAKESPLICRCLAIPFAHA